MTDAEKLQEKMTAWQEKLAKANAKRPELKEEFLTDSKIKVNPVYTPLDTESLDYLTDLGLPGEYPFTRGVQGNMYRSRLFTMRQYAGFGSAEETNHRFRYLLEQGQTGLSVAFDLPTQIGYDSDHPLARGELGKVGVAVDSLQDLEVLFDSIPLDKVTTSMTINSPAAILLAMYLALAEMRGLSFKQLGGTIQNDILKEYIARGTYIFPPEPSMRIITDIFAFCGSHVPSWNTISISGYHIREAGSTAVQEIAFTLANGIAYAEAALKAGLEVDHFAPRFSFFFNAHLNFFEEIAKFRAARRVWAKIMKERFKAKDPRSQMLRFHTQTAGCSLTAQQPMVNIMRVAYQALSACLGGTQSLHTNSYDEALALPSEQAALLALRTQQVVGYELGVTSTVDPLGGSYFIESLTEQIEEGVLNYIERIDDMGGAVRAIEQGFMQKEIQQSAYEYQKEIEDHRRTVIGVNKFVTNYEDNIELLKVNPEVAERQEARLKQLRQDRDGKRVTETLKNLRSAAKTQENLMPYIVDAVKAYATIGEICGILREVFGEYQQQVML